ncbi:MAG: hypothetical protein ACK51R_00090 [Hyphomonadaceae bacterium]
MTVISTPIQVFVYAAAAAAEIGGCFAVWAVLRNGAPKLWLLVGVCLLVIFAWLLTLIPSNSAGRAFAAYGRSPQPLFRKQRLVRTKHQQPFGS